VEAFSKLVECYDQGHKLPTKAYEYISESLGKQAAAVDESYFLLESRKAEGRRVPLAAVNMIIEACALMGDLDRAFATWAELEQLDLKPDAGTFNALLHTCIKTRELASGRRLLMRMAQDGIAPNASTYMHQCTIHVMSREPDAALNVLQQCKDADVVPPYRMYASLISMCIRTKKAEKAQELLQAMEKDGYDIARLGRRVAALENGGS